MVYLIFLRTMDCLLYFQEMLGVYLIFLRAVGTYLTFLGNMEVCMIFPRTTGCISVTPQVRSIGILVVFLDVH